MKTLSQHAGLLAEPKYEYAHALIQRGKTVRQVMAAVEKKFDEGVGGSTIYKLRHLTDEQAKTRAKSRPLKLVSHRSLSDELIVMQQIAGALQRLPRSARRRVLETMIKVSGL